MIHLKTGLFALPLRYPQISIVALITDLFEFDSDLKLKSNLAESLKRGLDILARTFIVVFLRLYALIKHLYSGIVILDAQHFIDENLM